MKALRAFRVLRPLRLISGVPSEYCASLALEINSFHSFRSANCDERHPDGDHPSDEHCPPRALRHHHLLNYWVGAVHGSLPQDLL